MNPAISEELESVAKIGLSRDGFEDVARWSVVAKANKLESKRKNI